MATVDINVEQFRAQERARAHAEAFNREQVQTGAVSGPEKFISWLALRLAHLEARVEQLEKQPKAQGG